ncbi:MAG: hypothetical protein FWG90_12030 [Oscillospiraceae bacterium]|nr:hypothetical protein [Oscillospiraceae bacterium]
MNNNVEQYVLAVLNILPRHMRNDVKQKLQSNISEMLKDRCGENVPEERDIRVVLAELGEPIEVAEQYSPLPIALISGSYYIGYIVTVKIVLISVVFGISLASVIEAFSNNGIAWYMSVMCWVVRLVPGLFLSYGITTFIFALLERLKNTRK